jgi:arylsulfatase
VDTLRPDHLESYGYERGTSPQLERWFEDGAIFERAYAAHASTPPSVVSILSGQYPPEHRVRLFFQLLPDETRVLPDWLPERYQSAAFVSNGVLTDEALGMARRFDHYDDHVDELEPSRTVFERSAGRTTDAALAWLATQRDPVRPLFLWLHYNDPHGPYRAPDDAPARFSHEKRVPVEWRRIRDYQRDPGVADALDFVDRYDEEIAYVDAEIDRLLRGYAAHSDIDAALVVVIADHGESMIEHERWFTHGYEVYEEIIRVPLMLRGPGVVSGRFDEIVSSIDVAPTILRHLGIPQPKALPGTSLQPLPPDAAERTVYAEGGEGATHLRAAIRGQDKWVARMSSGVRMPNARVHFDLRADPHELAPQKGSAVPPELLALCELDPDPGGQPVFGRRGEPLGGAKVAPRASPEDLERLRTLGYVE